MLLDVDDMMLMTGYDIGKMFRASAVYSKDSDGCCSRVFDSSANKLLKDVLVDGPSSWVLYEPELPGLLKDYPLERGGRLLVVVRNGRYVPNGFFDSNKFKSINDKLKLTRNRYDTERLVEDYKNLSDSRLNI